MTSNGSTMRRGDRRRGRGLARLAGAGEPLGRRVETLLDGVDESWRRFAGPLAGFLPLIATSSAHRAAGEVQ